MSKTGRFAIIHDLPDGPNVCQVQFGSTAVPYRTVEDAKAAVRALYAFGFIDGATEAWREKWS